MQQGADSEGRIGPMSTHSGPQQLREAAIDFTPIADIGYTDRPPSL